jgi:hypothetical protein
MLAGGRGADSGAAHRDEPAQDDAHAAPFAGGAMGDDDIPF